MPVVPIQSPGQISTDVPGVEVPVGNQGIVERAFARVGAGVAEIGTELLSEVKKSEAQAAVMQRTLKTQFDAEDYRTSLKNSSPDGYVRNEAGEIITDPVNGTPRTITDEYTDWVNKRFEDDQMAMPSKLAQELYMAEMHPVLGGSVRAIHNDQLELQVASYERGVSASIDEVQNRLLSTPSIPMAYQSLAKLKENVVANRAKMGPNGVPSGILPPARVSILENTINSKVTEGVYQGLRDQVLSAPPSDRSVQAREAIAVLEGRDAYSMQVKAAGGKTIAELMDPDTRAQHLAELRRFQKDGDDKAYDEIQNALRNQFAALRNGTADNASRAQIQAMFAKRIASAETEAQRKHYREQTTQWQVELLAYDQLGSLRSQMRKQSPYQWRATMDTFQGRMDAQIKNLAKTNPDLQVAAHSAFGQAAILAAKQDLLQIQDEIERERNSDAAAYVLKEFPSVQSKFVKGSGVQMSQAISLLLQKQRDLGIPNQYQRVVSRATSSEIGQMLNSANDATVTQTYEAIKARYGEYNGMLQEQLLADGTLSPSRRSLSIVDSFDDPAVKRDMMVNTIRAESLNTQFNDTIDAARRTSVKAAVAEMVSHYQSRSADGADTEYDNALMFQAQTEAQKIMLEDLNMSEYDVARKVQQKLFRGLAPIESGNTRFTVPPKDPSGTVLNPDIVRAYVDSHKAPEALSTMNVLVPNVMPNQPDYAKMSAAERERLYFRHIERNGFWRKDRSGYGVTLYVMNPDMVTSAIVRTKDGSPLSAKFRDMQNVDKFTREEMTSFLESVGRPIIRAIGQGINTIFGGSNGGQ